MMNPAKKVLTFIKNSLIIFKQWVMKQRMSIGIMNPYIFQTFQLQCSNIIILNS